MKQSGSRRGPARRAGGGPSSRPAASSGILKLQQAAGNRAVAGLVGQRLAVSDTAVAVQRALAAPGDVNQAAEDLYGYLVALATASHTEDILSTLLLQKGHKAELIKRYQDNHKRSLEADFSALSADDRVRAKAYLQYGQLRPADKMYLAIHGKLTDTATVLRVVAQLANDRAAAEKDFSDSYGDAYPTDTALPDGSQSRIGAALLDEMLSATFAERFKAIAVLTFRAPRAADDVKIATVMPTNDSTLLFNALQREDVKKIKADFKTGYGEDLTDYLTRETSLHTKKRALMLVDESTKPEDILIETVRIATSGYTSADTDFIWDAIAHATDAQIKAFKAALDAKDARLKDIDATLGGMNKQDRDRFNALLGIGDASGLLGDPVVTLLRREGGNAADTIFDVLRNSTGSSYEKYHLAYGDEKSPLRQYADQFTDSASKGWLLSYVFAPFDSRLKFVLTNPGFDDYVVFLITAFTDAAKRRQLAADADFGSKLAQLSTATQNRLLMALEPQNLSPTERAVWLDAAIKREGGGLGALTGSADALDDENRELQAAKARATAGGKEPSPEELKEIDRLGRQTDEALKTYLQVRDQLEAVVETIATTAVGLLVGILTAGAGAGITAELVLAQVARAAAASALAKVATEKAVKGDRFDVLGAQGAQAMLTGAVDGVMNVVGGAVAKTAIASGLEAVGVDAARQAAMTGFPKFASGLGESMFAGGLAGGAGGAVGAVADDKTWNDTFDHGMRKVLTDTVVGSAQGAAVGGGMHLAGAALGGGHGDGDAPRGPTTEAAAEGAARTVVIGLDSLSATPAGREVVERAVLQLGIEQTMAKSGKSAADLLVIVGDNSIVAGRLREFSNLPRDLVNLAPAELDARVAELAKGGDRRAAAALVQVSVERRGPLETLRRAGGWTVLAKATAPESMAMRSLAGWRDAALADLQEYLEHLSDAELHGAKPVDQVASDFLSGRLGASPTELGLGTETPLVEGTGPKDVARIIQRASDRAALSTTGLRDPKAMAAMAQEGLKLKESWAGLTPVERGQKLMELANERLRAAKVPELKKFVPLTDGDGAFDRNGWSLELSRDALANDTKFDWLLEASYHEARHAEQAFLVARLKAKEMSVDQMAKKVSDGGLGISKEVAQQAVGNEIDPASPEGRQAAEWFESMMGKSGSAARRAVYEAMDDARDVLEYELTRLAAAKGGPPGALDVVKEIVGTARDNYIQAVQKYKALPEEADAYAVQAEFQQELRKCQAAIDNAMPSTVRPGAPR